MAVLGVRQDMVGVATDPLRDQPELRGATDEAGVAVLLPDVIQITRGRLPYLACGLFEMQQ